MICLVVDWDTGCCLTASIGSQHVLFLSLCLSVSLSVLLSPLTLAIVTSVARLVVNLSPGYLICLVVDWNTGCCGLSASIGSQHVLSLSLCLSVCLSVCPLSPYTGHCDLSSSVGSKLVTRAIDLSCSGLRCRLLWSQCFHW